MRQILAVDDDQSTRALLQDVLTKAGYTVTGVPSGAEALRRLEFDSFDLLITDVRMPEMSGPELIAELQKDANNAKIPVLVLALSAELVDLGKTKVDGRLTKPFVPRVLVSAVTALIG